MAEKYRFFDAVQDENGQYDREYNAQEFTDYFKALVTTGIMKGAGNELAVAANGSNMITTVNTGIAFLLGRYYENDSSLSLTHDTETLGKSRIDRIVIRMDLSTEARYVKAFIKKGVPSTNPVPPALTQTSSLYEISLAQVKIIGGQTFIAANAVTDERGKDVICPYAGSNILPNFSDSSLGQPNGIAQLNSEGKVINADGTLAGPFDTDWINGTTVGTNWVPGLLQYRKVGDLVYIRAKVYANNVNTGVITTLPVGFRPRQPVYLNTQKDYISIDGNGTMLSGPSNPVNMDFSFAGVYPVL